MPSWGVRNQGTRQNHPRRRSHSFDNVYREKGRETERERALVAGKWGGGRGCRDDWYQRWISAQVTGRLGREARRPALGLLVKSGAKLHPQKWREKSKRGNKSMSHERIGRDRERESLCVGKFRSGFLYSLRILVTTTDRMKQPVHGGASP